MKKYRIALIETETFFGEKVKRYVIQERVALFWWVTIESMSTLSSARYYLGESGAMERRKKVKHIKVIE